jgi:hypothetical protein
MKRIGAVYACVLVLWHFAQHCHVVYSASQPLTGQAHSYGRSGLTIDCDNPEVLYVETFLDTLWHCGRLELLAK